MTEKIKMKVLNRPEVSPPGGYSLYQVEPTKVRITAKSLAGLEQAVRKHYKLNEIPIPPNIRQLVETWLCDRLGEEFWRYRGGPAIEYKRPLPETLPKTPGGPARKTKKRKFTMSQIENFTRALVGPIRRKEFVTEQEFMRRDAKCANCPLTSSEPGCFSCTAVLAPILRMLMGGKRWNRVSKNKLKVCTACGCLLRAKNWLSEEAITQLTAESDYRQLHSQCWIRDIEPIKNKYSQESK